MRTRKNKRQKKGKLIVISCTWEIWLSPNKNQESQIQKLKKMTRKLHKHKSFFSCKELLFSLDNYVWDEKWPSFITPSLISKLSIVTLFEPDKFPSLSRPKITPHTERQRQRKIFSKNYKRSNAWYWKANVRNWSSKRCWVHSMENRKMSKNKNVGKRELREIESQRRMMKRDE